MAYITILGNKSIEVSDEEAQMVRDMMNSITKRPESVEVSGHLIKLASIREVYFGETKPKEDNKYYNLILDWEAEVRERRGYSIPDKIAYTRSLMATAWKATHMQDTQKEGKYILEEVWNEYEKLATDFFARHPKRIYVDSHLWLPLYKPENQVNIMGEQVMTAIIKTIGNERDLARKDGELQEVFELEPKKEYASIGSFASVGDIIQEKVPVTRERSTREDWGIPEEDISIASIPF